MTHKQKALILMMDVLGLHEDMVRCIVEARVGWDGATPLMRLCVELQDYYHAH